MDINQISEKIKIILLENSKRSQVKDRSVFICCPFHGERTPSCSVTIYHEKFLPGTFHCFGCGESGNWNKLAEKIGIKYKVNEKELYYAKNATIKSDSSNLLRIENETVKDFIKNQYFDAYSEWPKNKNWRSIKYEFLKKIEAHIIYEHEEQKIFLPVKVNNNVVGGIRASIDKKKYLTTTGNWVKDKGLFPFDITKNMIEKDKWLRKFVVLVEGPRDVARLIINGIPSLAILGAKQWSKEKTELLLTLTSDDFEVLTMFDGDKAGNSAHKFVKNQIEQFVKVRRIRIPEFVQIDNENVKCDVFNLPKERLHKIKASIIKEFT